MPVSNIMTAFAALDPQSLCGKLVRLPLRLVPRSMVVPVLSGANRGMRWVKGSGLAGFWLGTFERHKQEFLARHLRPGMVAYDLGANIGFHSLAMARLVGPSGRVFAFEPHAANVLALRRHIALNRLDNVTVVQAAVSDKSGLVGFRSMAYMSAIDESSLYQVPAISLDAFIAAGFPPPDLVKMDIEGAEAAALAGASSLVAQRHAIWVIAAHSAALWQNCRQTMANAGYRLVEIPGTSRLDDAEADFVALPGVRAQD